MSHTTYFADLLIRSGGGAFPIDTKYKRYDLRKLSTGDIYQTFLCAFALTRGLSEARAMVVFPSDGPSLGHRLAVRSVLDEPGAVVSAMGVDIPRILDEIGRPEFQATIQGVRDRLTEMFDLT